MEKEVKKWRSPSLGKNVELRIYGESGTPLLAIPTREKGADQWEKKGMVDSISFQLENGYNQLFCIESADNETFFNDDITPAQRIIRHIQYESFVIEEVVPLIQENSAIDFLIVCGVDTGGYHAINLGLKHPNSFGKAIGISGVYDILPFMDNYYDENIYYNNPVDYLPNLTNEKLLDKIRGVDFRLVSYANDPRKDVAYRLDNIFKSKMLHHELDVWQMESDDEWDIWKQMFKIHIV
ncbi:alpha/beta hydrolase-fold protein [Aliifodinibius sp. S!AR15-10]|uniref:esterase family protein n=1 Tax=Aliifodinibius sp. S!AR15-10 TaxID=2950437 RepID=UPI002860BBF3|nr:alpha/beta hydrolase-fold protein [Aliifodinibius sp. S!AR15-10]MDR8391833.1 alpha/beta hydrolase-fold protein [Aliifodinibius sp. S!AR15-10]